MAHIHARDPKSPQDMAKSYEDYLTINIGVRENCPDMIVNNTAMGGRYFTMTEGATGWARESLPARPEVASLDAAQLVQRRRFKARPTGLGGRQQDEETDFFCLMRTEEGVASLNEFKKYGIKPEFELFSTGDIKLCSSIIKGAKPDTPNWISFVFGGFLGANTSIDMILNISRQLPENSLLNVIACGYAQLPLDAAAIVLGHHVRVGMEDNYFYSNGKLAESNAQLVERIVELARILGRPVATPAQAREILGLGTPRQYSKDFKPL
jgi:3-keto-5-aminohexanoate cleavage enzyme